MRLMPPASRAPTGRFVFVVCFLFSVLYSLPARAEDPWWAEDKGMHLAVSGALGAGVYTTLWLAGDDPRPLRLVLSASLALLPGLAKEIYDSGQQGNFFSGKDMLWNTVGVAAGVGLALGMELLVIRLRGSPASRVSLHLGGSAMYIKGRF